MAEQGCGLEPKVPPELHPAAGQPLHPSRRDRVNRDHPGQFRAAGLPRQARIHPLPTPGAVEVGRVGGGLIKASLPGLGRRRRCALGAMGGSAANGGVTLTAKPVTYFRTKPLASRGKSAKPSEAARRRRLDVKSQEVVHSVSTEEKTSRTASGPLSPFTKRHPPVFPQHQRHPGNTRQQQGQILGNVQQPGRRSPDETPKHRDDREV